MKHAIVFSAATLACGASQTPIQAPTQAAGQAPAQTLKPAGPSVPHAHYIQCPSHSLGAALELGPGGTYAGHGRDNYEDTRWDACTHSAAEVRCDGVWVHGGQPSQLVVTAAPDGTLKGTMLGAYKSYEMACVARETPLSGNCVFNPGTSSCPD